MADYWKSQGRKFCDFCKCWIADNKPSIQFHEGGKKHKENVSKRLKEIHKNSAKQAKITRKFENDLKNMENAAMAAYLKDVEGNTVDLTAQQIIQNKHAKNTQLSQEPDVPEYLPQATPVTNPRNKQSKNVPADVDFCNPTTFYRAQNQKRPVRVTPTAESKAANKSKKNKEKKNQEDEAANKKSVRKAWYEARSPEGYTYYWNTDTNETSWEVPEEGFLTFAEQEIEAEEQQIQNQFFELIDKEKEEETKNILEERRANAEREKMKRMREINEKKEENSEETKDEIPYRRDYSVPNRVDPYGPWQTISIKPQKQVDLQLPKKKKMPIVIKSRLPEEEEELEEPLPTFTEKTITKLGNDDEDILVAFKKRKFHNKNVRQRLTND